MAVRHCAWRVDNALCVPEILLEIKKLDRSLNQ